MIKKNINTNQKSFFFEDNSNKSLQQTNKSKLMITEDRVYLLFFVFFCLISIFTIKILLLSLGKINYEKNSIYLNTKFEIFRNDIVDINGIPIARNTEVFHAAIKPNLIKNKKNFLLKIQLLYPNKNIKKLNQNLKQNKYFY